jgi:DNA-directed RNA polymerase subunit M/transcription elongation factor TFIIS
MRQNKFPCEKCGSTNSKQISEVVRGKSPNSKRISIYECLRCGFTWSEDAKSREMTR